MAHLQRMVAPEQATRHARQVDRHAEAGHRLRQLPGLGGLHHRLAADHDQRALRLAQRRRGGIERACRRQRRRDGAHRGHLGVEAAREHARGVAVEVPAQRPVGQRAALAGRVGVPLADRGLVVQQVHRALDEHRPRHAALRQREGFGQRGCEVAHAPRLEEALDVRLDQRALGDVLQRAAALQRGGRGAAEQDQRRLRELRVLQRRDGVGDARPGSDRGHAGPPRQARRGVGRKHRGGLVAHVDDADAARLGRAQDRRDVPAAQREKHRHAMRLQHLGDAIAAMAGGGTGGAGVQVARVVGHGGIRPRRCGCCWRTSARPGLRPRLRCASA